MAITSNNVQNVKFLRNGSLFATREAARTALNGFELTYEKDGAAILARYGSNDAVKTLVGWVYANNSGNKSITIFDIDDAGTDAKNYVDSLLGTDFITSGNTVENNLTALSGNSSTDTSATTSVEGAKKYTDAKIAETIDGLDVTAITAPAGAFIKGVSQADGKVSATTEDMPTVAIQTETGKPIIAVSQTKGTLAASAGTIDAQYVNISDSGSLIAATDVEGALAEIAAEIDAMDLAQVGDGNGKVIIAVSEQDGKVSASATSVSDLTLEGFEANAATTGAVTSADTIEAAINKLENKAAAITIANADGSINVTTAATGTDINVNIKSGEHVLAKDGNAGIYTDIKLSAVTPSSTAVKEEYSLVATDGSVLGTNIKIYKDSHIVSITYITDTGDTHYQNLEYVYIDASGDTKTEYVDISSLVLEAEFASGITVTDHVAHGVVDSASEKDESNVAFLTVGADGFKVSGIKDAIDTKINKLDAEVTGGTTAGTATSNHVQVIVSEADGKLTSITVSEANIANASDLAELSGKTVTALTSTNGSITASIDDAVGCKTCNIETDASKIKMSGFASTDALSGITSSSSITQAFEEVDNVITTNEEIISSALNDLNTRIDELSGGSASDLAHEIAARKAVDGQNGDTYVANTSKAYISGATSLNDADIKLNDALKTVADNYVSGITVNGSGLTVTNNIAAVTVTPATGATTATGAEAITVQTDANGNITLGLANIDCGTY